MSAPDSRAVQQIVAALEWEAATLKGEAERIRKRSPYGAEALERASREVETAIKHVRKDSKK